jgi:prevent-host-death family protein
MVISMEIAAGEFKAKCLKLMDRVESTKEEIIITKRGKPIAKLVPFEEGEPPPLFGRMKGSVTIVGDIVAPLDVRWEADD